jgi:DNA gyrase subunit A
MRYTEARMQDFRRNIGRYRKETVDFQLNLMIPCMSQSNANTCSLLINGATGIAVGMATNMPPHNLLR